MAHGDRHKTKTKRNKNNKQQTATTQQRKLSPLSGPSVLCFSFQPFSPVSVCFTFHLNVLTLDWHSFFCTLVNNLTVNLQQVQRESEFHRECELFDYVYYANEWMNEWMNEWTAFPQQFPIRYSSRINWEQEFSNEARAIFQKESQRIRVSNVTTLKHISRDDHVHV
jgi:hypothetical protein